MRIKTTSKTVFTFDEHARAIAKNMLELTDQFTAYVCVAEVDIPDVSE